ncbi:hypothetical protein WA158_008026 [Blastocystis sp. Blastoise]
MISTQIYKFAQEIKVLPFFKNLVATIKNYPFIKDIDGIAAYGCGSVNDSSFSQYQLATAIALREELRIPRAIDIYDGTMGQVDVGIASELGVESHLNPYDGKRFALRKTLFYLPSETAKIYNNILWANWGENLSNVLMVGTSYATIAAGQPENPRSYYNAIKPLVPFLTDIPIPVYSANTSTESLSGIESAFPNCSVTYLNEDMMERASQCGLWNEHPLETDVPITKTEEELTDRASSLQKLTEKEEDEEEFDDSIWDELCNTSDGSLKAPDVSNMDVSSESWNSEPNTIHFNYIRENDPRKDIYVYADDGAGVSSRLMAVHSLRMFTDPSCYNVKLINADDFQKKNWEDNAALVLFPGGADRYYCQKLSTRRGNGSIKRIKQWVEEGGRFVGICAGAYFATERVEFGMGTNIQVADDRELGLFHGKAVGPALSGFSYTSNGGSYSVDFSFFDDIHKQNRVGTSFYKGGPYFVPSVTEVPNYSYIPILHYKRQKELLCPENSLAGVLTKNGKGMSLLTALHIEVDPYLLSRDVINNDELLDKLREPVYSQGRCRFFVKLLNKLGLETIPIDFEEYNDKSYNI